MIQCLPLFLRNNDTLRNTDFSVACVLHLKVSATLQDRPRADRCSVSCFYKNPYKPYIF